MNKASMLSKGFAWQAVSMRRISASNSPKRHAVISAANMKAHQRALSVNALLIDLPRKDYQGSIHADNFLSKRTNVHSLEQSSEHRTHWHPGQFLK
jgi:hypothetical protein